MKLITEIFDQDCEILKESAENGKKNYYIHGIFMQGDIQNRNGRIYPSPVLEKEMNRYNESFIKTKRALGELGHPNGPQINGDRVSHLITEMNRDGSNFVGKAKILSTPMGEIVKTFIDEGVKVGVSTRGLGSVKPTKQGIMEVQDDFHLATVDIVTDPSGPNCFVNGIMENTEYYFDIISSSWQPANSSNQVVENIVEKAIDNSFDAEAAMKAIEELKQMVNEMKSSYSRNVRKIDEQYAQKAFTKFIDSLKK
jgi:hypothetical protein